ncbi:MAG: ArsA family ATPase [Patulibacter sp.]|nr:ArsA family ATPase [Patulibacter sp.]
MSALTSTLDLDATLGDARVVVLAGGGGVGKTTTAAGIGLGLARRGRRVCVLTIDPARRLADALGLEAGTADEPVRVDFDGGERGADEGGGELGELWVVMLDAKATWDNLIRRYAADEATAERILANRVYREFSGAVAGSQEYMAVERLHELLESGRWDTVLLDTPPTRNALDFLDAPQRLHSFIDSRALQLLMKPAAGGLGLLGRGASVFTGLLKRVAGVDLLSDLIEFFSAIGGLSAGFGQRAKAVQALLAEPRTVFLLVAAPHPESLAEAGTFRTALTGRAIHYGGLIVNRMTRVDQTDHEDAVRRVLRGALSDPDAAERAVAMHATVRAQAIHDDRLVERHLRTGRGDEPVLLVPQLPEDVHDVAGLAALEEALFASAQNP